MPGLMLSASASNKSFDKTNVCPIECTRLALLEHQYCLTFLLVFCVCPQTRWHYSKALAGDLLLNVVAWS